MAKYRKFFGLVAILPASIAAQGVEKFRCSLGDLERRVEILYETSDAVPCEVHYHKDTEAPGERQVLWRANNQSGYCESKTRDFVAKLQDIGWVCQKTGQLTPDEKALPEPASDTDVLAPADTDEAPESG